MGPRLLTRISFLSGGSAQESVSPLLMFVQPAGHQHAEWYGNYQSRKIGLKKVYKRENILYKFCSPCKGHLKSHFCPGLNSLHLTQMSLFSNLLDHLWPIPHNLALNQTTICRSLIVLCRVNSLSKWHAIFGFPSAKISDSTWSVTSLKHFTKVYKYMPSHIFTSFDLHRILESHDYLHFRENEIK